ncbi:MAG: phosphoenolpyruvate carboxykinase, partial [Acidobacteriota bacterium]|nr:phosphoenolpyruvate carboxykinase [Acidobacteriota bacterium]
MAAIKQSVAREHGRRRSDVGLDRVGIRPGADVYWNLNTPELYELIARRGEGIISAHGALLVDTGEHTGRAARDKAIVREPSSEEKVFWGEVNKEFPQEKFDRLRDRMMRHASTRELFVQDTYAGADPRYRLPVRIITELAWHSLFARTMFINDDAGAVVHTPEFTVVNIPSFKADPATDGTRAETFILMDFAQRLVLIGGTSYAGETKKSVFSILNYLLPQRGVMSMHCSANVGEAGDVAIFFGLSGTGKTTLSADPERRLIGDDEHGWSDDGVFNFEGGCYAKVIKLSAEAEPDIYRTTRMFGTVMENVVFDPATRTPDLDDASRTENTRAAYPLTSIPNIVPEGYGSHPSNIIMLTADAFGVLPPVAKLTPEQAMYHFLSGYTAKVAGTERGVKEPQATFSACFGAVFLVWHPSRYAQMLGTLLERHNAQVWLVNTGWTGGAYGAGERMKLGHTRAMIRAALGGELTGAPTVTDPVFGLAVPKSIRDVPSALL